MLVYLKPLSLFPFVHSDTLFGAICSAVSELFPDKIDEMIEDFKNNPLNPPFILSSMFPCVKDKDEYVRFYPKIITTNSRDMSDINAISLKKYKQVNYISEDIFLEIISGSLSEEEIIRNIDDYHIYGDLLTKNETSESFKYNELIIPRNTVNRMDNSSESIFYTNGYQFKGMNLYFIVHFYDETYRPIIESAIKFLKDHGFGKDISVGKGQFDYKLCDDIIEKTLLENSGSYFVTLSRYTPTISNIKHINNYSAYEISSKRGRSIQGEIRKQFRFFTEGSTFSNYEKYYGQIIHSGIHTPAVEYGYAFPVGYNKCD